MKLLITHGNTKQSSDSSARLLSYRDVKTLEMSQDTSQSKPGQKKFIVLISSELFQNHVFNNIALRTAPNFSSKDKRSKPLQPTQKNNVA